MPMRRSEGRRGRSSGVRFGAIVAAMAIGGLLGCHAPEIVEDTFPAHMIYEGRTLAYEEANLSEITAQKRLDEIDRQFAEPRTPAGVRLSQETCQYSITGESHYGALWRGSRACAWLAGDAASSSERSNCALDGIAWGKAAVERDSADASSYYYLAINYLHLFDMQLVKERRLAGRIKENLRMARSLDPQVDHCGPSRALGLLIVMMVDQPLLSLGTRSGGITLLKEATQIRIVEFAFQVLGPGCSPGEVRSQ